MSEVVEAWVGRIALTITATLVLSVVGIYAYGVSQPDQHEATVRVALPVSAEAAHALLADFPRRPAWRPPVARIGRIDDDAQGRAVWRELNASDERHDIVVVEHAPPERLVIGTASPEQIGYDATWSFTLRPEGEGVAIDISEAGRIDNPLWRGIFWLRGGPWPTLNDEATWLATALEVGPPVIERR